VVIGLTGAWWWQNHKAQQEEIATMADQSSAQLSQNNEGQSVPLTDGNADAGTNVPLVDNSATPADTGAAAQAPAASAQAPSAAQQQPAVVSPSQTTLPETAPAAVQIQYQGKPVDLSRFVKSNRVARLTVAAQ